ncbi:MAG: sigma-70 family RNA polymerase sigma factor [Pseudomonadales bacterium]
MNNSADTNEDDRSVDLFLAFRPRMLGIAYRMLGTMADAEDVIQEVYERWHGIAASDPVRDSSVLLVTLTTRLCIDRYRRERTRREAYAGSWLPEPVSTPADDPLAHLESERMLSLGLLRVLEHLSPLERAVFVLADAFDYRAGEIASVIGRTEAHCRQLLHRARKSVKPMIEAPVDARRKADNYREGLSLLGALLEALQQGNVEQAERLLAADVALYSDGGGKVAAVKRQVTGSRAVARLLVGLARQQSGSPSRHFAYRPINGYPALILYDHGEVETVMVVEHAGAQVCGAFVQRNPDKLARLTASLLRST